MLSPEGPINFKMAASGENRYAVGGHNAILSRRPFLHTPGPGVLKEFGEIFTSTANAGPVQQPGQGKHQGRTENGSHESLVIGCRCQFRLDLENKIRDPVCRKQKQSPDDTFQGVFYAPAQPQRFVSGKRQAQKRQSDSGRLQITTIFQHAKHPQHNTQLNLSGQIMNGQTVHAVGPVIAGGFRGLPSTQM